MSFPKEGLSLQRLVHRAHPGLFCVAHEDLDVLFNGYDEIVFADQHVIIIFDLPEYLYMSASWTCARANSWCTKLKGTWQCGGFSGVFAELGSS